MNEGRVKALIGAGQLFHQRGWVPGTAGNLSFRIDATTLAITRSGCHKGELTAHDIVAVDLDGTPRNVGDRCSAETLLHCQLYRRFASVSSVLHTHSVWATVMSQARDHFVLRDYELLKALSAIETHETTVTVPVFENVQDIARLARAVDEWLEREPAPHAYLIRGHGLYTWGESVEVARYRIEALEFLLECEYRRSGAR
jgi:methylthioribulose-1-phosphate dehydratase